MERGVSIVNTTSYVGWEEIWVCGERGRREVHYFLKKKNGAKDLAVIGKEKSLRHMVYYFHVENSMFFKVKSRREVINWLNTIVPVSDLISHQPCKPIEEELNESEDFQQFEDENLKEINTNKMGKDTTEFTWLGSSWTSRKKRKHYQSFRRNGVHIYVHDFVYVLAEEGKRLVAYLEDMYEDSRTNKMVIVRWFHKIDEVGIYLPSNYSNYDKQIFFSLCLQDLSIECIDGLASILSPQHYDLFTKLPLVQTHDLQPFVCQMMFENDEVKPFDVSKVKGYWRQNVFKFMGDVSRSEGLYEEDESRPLKRLRRFGGESDGGILGNEFCEGFLKVGGEVEVLCQDSGIRGCWFRGLIVKIKKNRVKVQYLDLKDADDETKNLEEWVLASKLAVPDERGTRTNARPTLRPSPSCNKSGPVLPSSLNLGTIVDVWAHDGWWEGIIIKKESNEKLLIYFPGEKREESFNSKDLRLSQEWQGQKWNYMKERPDLVASILSQSKPKLEPDKKDVSTPTETHNSEANKDEGKCVRDLLKDGLLTQLKWKCSKKRGASRSPVHKSQNYGVVNTRVQKSEKFIIRKSMKVENDHCKTLFGSSAVEHLTGLVLSR